MENSSSAKTGLHGYFRNTDCSNASVPITHTWLAFCPLKFWDGYSRKMFKNTSVILAKVNSSDFCRLVYFPAHFLHFSQSVELISQLMHKAFCKSTPRWMFTRLQPSFPCVSEFKWKLSQPSGEISAGSSSLCGFTLREINSFCSEKAVLIPD